MIVVVPIVTHDDPPVALSVVPLNERLVPSVISSIAPVEAVHLHNSLFVLIVSPDAVASPSAAYIVSK